MALAFSVQAEVTMKKEKVNPERTEAVRHIWFRDGVKVVSQNIPTDENKLSLCIISPFEKEKGNAALALSFTDGRISSIFNGPALEGYGFCIDDFTRDGVPDIIQIVGENQENGQRRLIEAYSIIGGIVEPIPDRLIMDRSDEFYFDDDIIAYLKSKLEPDASGQRR
ncbi:hypothetical protein DDZ13_14940 [Coraliomargarita sinensis]|uniref:Uncharacterized protein n=1 Tax=Coraliomargarita sinensis TaxID=2174842 RepID=A0A317ZCJ4_9BACT|nr:hypothetical protein [Coraliomargarita sinensis]PXA02864.1 hypothetical protein DDZ13_14940 [Coraliomargarita sinensis]